jgi:eukaryotic-like serine/threonine-protein kinase
VLSNRYELAERIATGGMGDVWRGTDVLLGRTVAIKVLLPALVSDSEFITRFRAEARLMASLRHAGIVQVHDYGEQAVVGDSRLDYLVMEYVEGVSLSTWIRTAGRLGVAETTSVVAQAAEALQVAHDAGIVHRDVKPSNLLVRPDGTVVLVDFGVARSTDLTSITSTNVILGSAHYMAPEQASGQPVSPATDIYALGTVAYSCLAGRPPFTGDNPLQIVAQHVQGEAPALPPDVPAPVVAVVTRALAKDPADRYASAAAFAAAARDAQDATAAIAVSPPADTGTIALEAATSAIPVGPIDPFAQLRPGPAEPAAGYPSIAEPPTVIRPRTGGNRRRNAALAGVAGAVVLGLIAVLGVTAFGSNPDRREALSPATGSPVDTPATSADRGGADAVGQATGGPTQKPRPGVSSTAAPPAATDPAPARSSSPAPKPSSSGDSTKNPYTPSQVCGSGYKVIDSAPLNRYGTVYLLYNAGNGNNCSVTLKTTSVGTRTAVSAYLEPQGKSRVSDSGSFEYYAGPLRAKASGVCVAWGGSAGGVSYRSPFEHCD